MCYAQGKYPDLDWKKWLEMEEQKFLKPIKCPNCEHDFYMAKDFLFCPNCKEPWPGAEKEYAAHPPNHTGRK
jgi:hypothetical protein